MEKSVDNYTRLEKAFQEFGMPVFDMTAFNFLDNPALDVFTFGRPPVAIDIITNLKGLTFAEAYAAASEVEIDAVVVQLIHYQHLLCAKKAAGRPRDQNDLENLERHKQ